MLCLQHGQPFKYEIDAVVHGNAQTVEKHGNSAEQRAGASRAMAAAAGGQDLSTQRRGRREETLRGAFARAQRNLTNVVLQTAHCFLEANPAFTGQFVMENELPHVQGALNYDSRIANWLPRLVPKRCVLVERRCALN